MAKIIQETERLIIEEITLEDASFIYELLNSSNWIQFIGDRGIRSLEDAAKYINNNVLQQYLFNGFGLYKILLKNTQTPIGIIGFLKRDYLDHVDIGFALLPKFERKGFAFEASQALLLCGKNKFRFEKVCAVTTASNQRSIKLLTALGLKEMRSVLPDNGQDEFIVFE